MRSAVKPFGYVRDPLCLLACAAYATNRWCIPTALKGAFLRGYFADLLLVPAALPLLLWVQRRLGLRAHDQAPSWQEVGLHWFIWSIAAEVCGPLLFSRATGDPWDVGAYALGSLAAGWFWRSA